MSTREDALLREIEQGTEKETIQKLRANPSAAFAIRLSSLAQKKIDGVYEEVVRKGAHFDCAKGCSFCCRQSTLGESQSVRKKQVVIQGASIQQPALW